MSPSEQTGKPSRCSKMELLSLDLQGVTCSSKVFGYLSHCRLLACQQLVRKRVYIDLQATMSASTLNRIKDTRVLAFSNCESEESWLVSVENLRDLDLAKSLEAMVFVDCRAVFAAPLSFLALRRDCLEQSEDVERKQDKPTVAWSPTNCNGRLLSAIRSRSAVA